MVLRGASDIGAMVGRYCPTSRGHGDIPRAPVLRGVSHEQSLA
mgnify:CR=1 FL=1